MYTDDDDKEDYNEDESEYTEENRQYQIINEYSGVNYDSYIDNNNMETEVNPKKTINKKRLIKLIIILVLIIILSIIIYSIIHLDTKTPDVRLLTENITINAGETGAIAYEIVDTEERVSISFVSMYSDIVSVDANGNIYGIKKGTSTITMVYYINGTRYEKKCNVFVE